MTPHSADIYQHAEKAAGEAIEQQLIAWGVAPESPYGRQLHMSGLNSVRGIIEIDRQSGFTDTANAFCGATLPISEFPLSAEDVLQAAARHGDNEPVTPYKTVAGPEETIKTYIHRVGIEAALRIYGVKEKFRLAMAKTDANFPGTLSR